MRIRPLRVDPFALFPVVFIGFFVVVIGIILYAAGRGVGQWVSDNGQPVLTAPARIVAKRTEISGGGQRRAWTDHYATFELANGSRQEFGIDGGEYGLLAEGDQGDLTYQGSRYKGFSRKT